MHIVLDTMNARNNVRQTHL